MTPPDRLTDDDLLGQEPALLQWALALTKDPVEAQTLVAQTLSAALAEGRPADRAGLFQTFRQTYHSVARSRSRRSARDAMVTALARAPADAAAAVRTA
jgi:hypothetical protein